ncbi:hypothetical protein R84B8_01751 [Treponema sp. R8-4-B8]
MACLFDYIKWRGDLDFNVSPFNPVDNIIFSQLSYLTLDGIVPGPEDNEGISIALAVRVYNEKSSQPGFKLSSIFKEDNDLIRALGASRRFGNCQLFGFVNNVNEDREIQFSAVCVYTSDDHCFVAYRGTDSSILGWKEDFNMCFKDVIPSQLAAVDYLEKMAPKINGSLRVGGHSKGGNLAIYATSKCDSKIQKRITTIYSNDSPGFSKEFINSSGFNAIKDKICFYVPQSSIIGMFMEHGTDYTVIKSNESGLMQHNLYSWDVAYNDLVPAEKTTVGSKFVNDTLREWLANLDNEERENFIEAVYHILTAADIKSLSELDTSWFSLLGRVYKSQSNMEDSKKKIIWQTLKELVHSAGRNLDTLLKK